MRVAPPNGGRDLSPFGRAVGWLRRHRPEQSTPGDEPGTTPPDSRIVLGGYLDLAAAGRVRALASTGAHRIVLDVGQLNGFDSAGLDTLLQLQADLGAERLRIDGLETATSRIVGLDPAPIDLDEPAGRAARVRVSVLNHVAVVRPSAHAPSDGALAAALRDATRPLVTTVVLDLVDVTTLSPSALWEVAESAAELSRRGRHVLIVNVAPALIGVLNNTAMPADVYIAAGPDS